MTSRGDSTADDDEGMELSTTTVMVAPLASTLKEAHLQAQDRRHRTRNNRLALVPSQVRDLQSRLADSRPTCACSSSRRTSTQHRASKTVHCLGIQVARFA